MFQTNEQATGATRKSRWSKQIVIVMGINVIFLSVIIHLKAHWCICYIFTSSVDFCQKFQKNVNLWIYTT